MAAKVIKKYYIIQFPELFFFKSFSNDLNATATATDCDYCMLS
jgi:hypothetical protein